MEATKVERASWKTVLMRQGPLLLPAAHDALNARLIERAAFTAYPTGGFALAGSAHAAPNLDLMRHGFDRKIQTVRWQVGQSSKSIVDTGSRRRFAGHDRATAKANRRIACNRAEGEPALGTE